MKIRRFIALVCCFLKIESPEKARPLYINVTFNANVRQFLNGDFMPNCKNVMGHSERNGDLVLSLVRLPCAFAAVKKALAKVGIRRRWV